MKSVIVSAITLPGALASNSTVFDIEENTVIVTGKPTDDDPCHKRIADADVDTLFWYPSTNGSTDEFSWVIPLYMDINRWVVVMPWNGINEYGPAGCPAILDGADNYDKCPVHKEDPTLGANFAQNPNLKNLKPVLDFCAKAKDRGAVCEVYFRPNTGGVSKEVLDDFETEFKAFEDLLQKWMENTANCEDFLVTKANAPPVECPKDPKTGDRPPCWLPDDLQGKNARDQAFGTGLLKNPHHNLVLKRDVDYKVTGVMSDTEGVGDLNPNRLFELAKNLQRTPALKTSSINGAFSTYPVSCDGVEADPVTGSKKCGADVNGCEMYGPSSLTLDRETGKFVEMESVNPGCNSDPKKAPWRGLKGSCLTCDMWGAPEYCFAGHAASACWTNNAQSKQFGKAAAYLYLSDPKMDKGSFSFFGGCGNDKCPVNKSLKNDPYPQFPSTGPFDKDGKPTNQTMGLCSDCSLSYQGFEYAFEEYSLAIQCGSIEDGDITIDTGCQKKGLKPINIGLFS